MNAMPILIRREFWEHRVLWIAPLALVVLYIIACLIPGAVHVDGMPARGVMANIGPERAVVIFVTIQAIFTVFLFLLMSLVVFFYLADCLYAERKDRSILFWKSLPVSDSATVLSKLLVALVIMPLGVWVLALVTNLLAFGILQIRFHDSAVVPNFIQWDTVSWLRLNAYLVMDVLVVALWYAPVAGYQLLISAWARSTVLVWTLLPPLVLIVGELIFLRSSHVWDFVAYRLWTGLMNHRSSYFDIGPGPRSRLEDALDSANLLPVLGNINLWIGVGVAIALVFAAIRIRRYRDDS